ncbi:MAG: ABC transporter ATP-binding protein [Spirochaetales bacterium]|nr:ABC transporter ATP-binding protein [Spirochaetales bacterium]
MVSFFKRFNTYIKPYAGVLVLAVFTMLCVDIIAYMIPLCIGYITDHIFPFMHTPGMIQKLLIICGVLMLAGIIRGIVSHVMIRSYWHVGEVVVRDLRNGLYEKLQHLDLAFYDQARTGDLMSRVTTDILLIRDFFAFGIEHRLRIILITLTIFVLMLMQEWRLALAVYGLIPFLYLVVVSFSKKMRKAVTKKQKQMGIMTARVQENITGIRIVKAFAMENKEIETFHSENKKMLEREIKMSLLQVDLNSILLLTNGAGSLIILLFGGYLVITSQLTLGVLFAFIAYLGLMGFPINMLAFNTSLINLALGAGDRIWEILQCADQQQINRNTLQIPLRGKIAFRQVSFGYQEHVPVLKDLNFTIQPGEKVALFGLTGAGKSTLISLIPRFYLPGTGRIEIDDRDISDWELGFLRSRIGIVQQETFLFSSSIKENIAFGKPGTSLEEIQRVARLAHIDEFINGLPLGYDTLVGEYGIGLSGGQKQRVAIARTLLQDPALLILDDCTSSLDTITERKIQAQLQELMKGRTTIIIAQRISTLDLAERIIVLDRGTIQDIDTHPGLMKRNKLYRKTYEHQLAHLHNNGY